jgi:hypothetical protein
VGRPHPPPPPTQHVRAESALVGLAEGEKDRKERTTETGGKEAKLFKHASHETFYKKIVFF